MWVINLKKQFVNEDHGICHVMLLHDISETHPSLADRTLIPMCGAGSLPLGLVLVPPTTCPGRAVVLSPSRALGTWCFITQGGYCVPRLLPWLLHNLLLLTWNLMCLRYRGWLLSLGIQLTFFFYLILLFLSCLPFPFCYCLQAKYISWKISFSIRLCASPRKKYFCLQKKGN